MQKKIDHQNGNKIKIPESSLQKEVKPKQSEPVPVDSFTPPSAEQSTTASASVVNLKDSQSINDQPKGKLDPKGPSQGNQKLDAVKIQDSDLPSNLSGDYQSQKSERIFSKPESIVDEMISSTLKNEVITEAHELDNTSGYPQNEPADELTASKVISCALEKTLIPKGISLTRDGDPADLANKGETNIRKIRVKRTFEDAFEETSVPRRQSAPLVNNQAGGHQIMKRRRTSIANVDTIPTTPPGFRASPKLIGSVLDTENGNLAFIIAYAYQKPQSPRKKLAVVKPGLQKQTSTKLHIKYQMNN